LFSLSAAVEMTKALIYSYKFTIKEKVIYL